MWICSENPSYSKNNGSEDVEKVRFDGKGIDQVHLDSEEDDDSEESSDQSILSFTQANVILISTLKNN